MLFAFMTYLMSHWDVEMQKLITMGVLLETH